MEIQITNAKCGLEVGEVYNLDDVAAKNLINNGLAKIATDKAAIKISRIAATAKAAGQKAYAASIMKSREVTKTVAFAAKKQAEITAAKTAKQAAAVAEKKAQKEAAAAEEAEKLEAEKAAAASEAEAEAAEAENADAERKHAEKVEVLNSFDDGDLLAFAKEAKIKGVGNLKKEEIIAALIAANFTPQIDAD